MLNTAGLASPFFNTLLQSVEELQKGIMGKVPAKIDIGPVYSVDPRRRAAYAGVHIPHASLPLPPMP